ncbi:sigma-70 family RNA polymerase sigma factor [Polymorphospora rubra]|uniref:RNA polymerase subunit sigma-24 n=1 Tax=Polymorphospora rubra TaxID=338584 RepID=A0A810MWA3_9ACTN|nr:sigma-70 family RNA polymerase sigma factor [Polymorphospora rubra]BCJ64814.1 RNA polymerase subunit sigma-24 [Polymorphospora rubra]
MTFEEFLHAEMAGLSRFAGAVCGDHHLAEDVLSDALVTVSARWHRIVRMDHPLAYVRRVVTRTFLSELRKTRRRRTESTADMTRLDQSQDDASGVVGQRDEVRRLLSALTPQQRTAVVLRYMFDQTDGEIAAVLNCSAATVRSHLSHARSTLRLTVTKERGRS